MRVLFLIPKAKAPTLEGTFSTAFKDFVGLCLIKDPAQRPSAKELLQHRFVKYAGKKTSTLTELIERHVAWKVAKGKDGGGGGPARKNKNDPSSAAEVSANGAERTLRPDDTMMSGEGDETMMSAWSFDSVRQDIAERLLELEEEEDGEGEAGDEDAENLSEAAYHKKLSAAMKSMTLSQQNLVSLMSKLKGLGCHIDSG